MENKYPTILRRYISTLIDVLFIFFIIIIISYLFQHENELIKRLRIVIILSMFFIYEPLFTSKFCTLGQKIMGIRVRDRLTLERITIPMAYLRIIVKLFLGLISFFTIPLSKDKRAIHDFAVNSIVIIVKSG